jgi:hypothetical protein
LDGGGTLEFEVKADSLSPGATHPTAWTAERVIESPAGVGAGCNSDADADADAKPQDAVGSEEAAPVGDEVCVSGRPDAEGGHSPIFSALVKDFRWIMWIRLGLSTWSKMC